MSEENDESFNQQEPHIKLIKAIKQNNIQQINSLIQQAKNENIDIINYQIRYQPIHLAVWIGNMKIFLLLIQNGANVDAISDNHMNCLTIAVYRQHVNLVQALIANIKDPNYLSKRGTALHIAAQYDNEEIMALLLKHPKIDINLKFKNQTPIQLAGSTTKKLLLQQERMQKSLILISNSFINSDSLLLNQFQMPVLITGFAEKVGWLGFKHSRRFLYLDAINGIFATYQSKEDYPLKPNEIMAIELINSVKLSNNLLFSKSQVFYLEIKYSNNKAVWYGFQSNDIATSWKERLEYARQYYQHFTNKYVNCYSKNNDKKATQYFYYEMELKTKLQLIEIKDPNQIVQNFNKNSSNLLNFQQDHQEQLIQQSIKLSDFKILTCIGKGSFGYVYKVELKNKVWALKQQDKQRLKQSNNLDYVLTEVKILRTINHPFIVNYLMSFQTTKNLYLVLELLQQGDLAMFMTRGVILDLNISRLLIGQIVLAIEHLHKHDILYRDLKPENICIDASSYIKLIDFGLCKYITENELTYTLCGSPAYLAPEVLNNNGISKSTDVYQIGLLLYEMLTGYPPFYTREINVLINRIKNGILHIYLESIYIPMNLNEDAQDLLKLILKRNALERINIEQMKKHKFFENLDWNLLEKKEIKIPQLIKVFPQSQKARKDLVDSDYCLNDYIQDWDFSTV